MNEPGKTCPICHQDIGYWPLLKAPLPNMITCHYCKAHLRYDKNGWKLFFGAGAGYCLLVTALVTLYLRQVIGLEPSWALLTWLVSSICYWLATEFCITTYLRNNQRLIAKKPLSATAL